MALLGLSLPPNHSRMPLPYGYHGDTMGSRGIPGQSSAQTSRQVRDKRNDTLRRESLGPGTVASLKL